MLLFSREERFTVKGAVVLNGLPVALAAAQTAAWLKRLNGTAMSRRSAFELPAPEAIEEFHEHFA